MPEKILMTENQWLRTHDRRLAMTSRDAWPVSSHGPSVIGDQSSVLKSNPSRRKAVEGHRRRTIAIRQLVPPPFGLGRHDVLHVRRVPEAQHVTRLVTRGVLHGIDVVRRRELDVRERDPPRATGHAK